MPQPVSHRRCPLEPTARLVPPTEVTSGLESGNPPDTDPNASRLSPSSPDAKKMPMPCACACWNTEFSDRTSPFEASLSGMPQLLETTFARCLSTTSFRARSSPFDVFAAPT